jgi:hypothetical protein
MLARTTVEVTAFVTRSHRWNGLAFNEPAFAASQPEVRCEVTFEGLYEPVVTYLDAAVVQDMALSADEDAALQDKAIELGLIELKRRAAFRNLPTWAVARAS